MGKIFSFNKQISGDYDLGHGQEVKFQYIQVYVDVQQLMLRVDRVISFHLFFWILVNMDKKNRIYMTRTNKDQFNEDIMSGGHKGYGIRYIEKAIIELRDAGILKAMKRSEYEVNINTFWKDTIDSRKATIQANLNQMQLAGHVPDNAVHPITIEVKPT